jgi:hypothetical protein
LDTNLGFWWVVLGLSADRPGRTLRSSEIRCLVRDEQIPRLADSILRYPDQGHLAAVDLGGGKDAGWSDRKPQARPRFGGHVTEAWKSSRLTRGHGDEHAATNGGPMLRREYDRLVQRIRRVVADALPAESTVLVVAKGDDAFLELDCREAWHFPVGEDGTWIGYHPPDDEWAIERLEAMRACGADYLVLPATSTWWLERYPELAGHLTFHYPIVVDDDACVIFALCRFPALYGRKRDAAVHGYLEGVEA